MTLTINLPDKLEFDEKELTMYLVAKLYEEGRISMGKGAEITGLSREKFMERLGDFGVSVFNYPPEELARDIKNA